LHIVRTLASSLAKINNLAPDTRYVTLKTSGYKCVRAIAIANYLALIIEEHDDDAVSDLGRLEHVNVVFIAKLVRAIRIAMLEYTTAKRGAQDYTWARTTKDAKRPVVIQGGDGFADEVAAAQLAARLRRTGERM
jgi:hypothetical protein